MIDKISDVCNQQKKINLNTAKLAKLLIAHTDNEELLNIANSLQKNIEVSNKTSKLFLLELKDIVESQFNTEYNIFVKHNKSKKRIISLRRVKQGYIVKLQYAKKNRPQFIKLYYSEIDALKKFIELCDKNKIK